MRISTLIPETIPKNDALTAPDRDIFLSLSTNNNSLS